jgi:ribonuclease HI
MIIDIFTDGGARGNPGPAGFGVVIKNSENKTLYQNSSFLGIKTNNEAEYAGLIDALNWIKNNYENFGVTQANIFSDSQLMVRQLQGLYKVKSSNLKPLFAQSQKILENIPISFTFGNIPREQNTHADRLANQAMDTRL